MMLMDLFDTGLYYLSIYLRKAGRQEGQVCNVYTTYIHTYIHACMHG